MKRKILVMVLAVLMAITIVAPAMAVTRVTNFAWECDHISSYNGAFFMVVTEVDEENETVKGISMGTGLSDSIEQGFTQELSVYHKDMRIPYQWSSMEISDFDLSITGSTLFVRPGDVISNYETDKWHSMVCEEIAPMEFNLTFVETPEQPYPDDGVGYDLAIAREEQDVAVNVMYYVEIDGVLIGQLGPGESLFIRVPNSDPRVVIRRYDRGEGYPGRACTLGLMDGRFATYSFMLNEVGSIASQRLVNATKSEDEALSWE